MAKKERGVFEKVSGSEVWWGAVKWIVIGVVALFCLQLFREELSRLLYRVAGVKNFDTFWIAMAPITTLVGLGLIYLQIRHGVKSADVNLVLSLRDRFWSSSMVKVRKEIKSPDCITYLSKLKRGPISPKDVKVYSETFIPQFTIFDFFESIGALCRKDKRLLKLIEPLLGGDIIFHYKLHEAFYNLDEVKSLYSLQNFKYLAELCIKKRLKTGGEVPTFEDIISQMLTWKP